MVVKGGTLMDATLVESQGRRVLMKEEATDRDAAWTRKGGRYHYGYKVHIGVDKESGLNTEGGDDGGKCQRHGSSRRVDLRR